MAPLAVTAAVFLLLLLLQGAAAAEKRSYVVYLGEEHGAAELAAVEEMAAGSHHDLLAAAVLGDKEKAREAIFYSHTKHINGFAANNLDATELASELCVDLQNEASSPPLLLLLSSHNYKYCFIIMGKVVCMVVLSILVCLVKAMLQGFTAWYEAEHNRSPLRDLCKLLHCLLRFAAKFAIFVVRFAWQILTELLSPFLAWFVDELKFAFFGIPE